MSSQCEITIAQYGVQQDGIVISRATAKHIASFAVDHYVNQSGSIFSNNVPGCIGRIVDVRFEDESSDGTKGQVIAMYEPVAQHTEPYKPKNMEYK